MPMRWLRFALWPAGLAFGVAAEWVGRPDLIGLDAAAGFALVFLGLVAWSRRPGSRAGPIMAAAGFVWFLGTLWPPAVFLHRGPLAQLLISYPSGRLSSRLQRVGAGVAYAYAAADVVAGSSYATIIFALGLVALLARRYVGATGTERRARLASLTAAAAFGLVLVAGAIVRLAGVGSDRAMLAWYDLTVCLIAVGLAADLVWGGWARGAVTGLVVDLGEPAAGGVLRDRLARTLGDPTLVVGYWLPGQRRYVDEAGRPVKLPAAGVRRAVTPIEENGRGSRSSSMTWPFSTILPCCQRPAPRPSSRFRTRGFRLRWAHALVRWRHRGAGSSRHRTSSATALSASSARAPSGGSPMWRSCSLTAASRWLTSAWGSTQPVLSSASSRAGCIPRP
jgi:hypothetical protein